MRKEEIKKGDFIKEQTQQQREGIVSLERDETITVLYKDNPPIIKEYTKDGRSLDYGDPSIIKIS